MHVNLLREEFSNIRFVALVNKCTTAAPSARSLTGKVDIRRNARN